MFIANSCQCDWPNMTSQTWPVVYHKITIMSYDGNVITGDANKHVQH